MAEMTVTEVIVILAILGFVGCMAVLVRGVGRDKNGSWDKYLADHREEEE